MTCRSITPRSARLPRCAPSFSARIASMPRASSPVGTRIPARAFVDEARTAPTTEPSRPTTSVAIAPSSAGPGSCASMSGGSDATRSVPIARTRAGKACSHAAASIPSPWQAKVRPDARQVSQAIQTADTGTSSTSMIASANDSAIEPASTDASSRFDSRFMRISWSTWRSSLVRAAISCCWRRLRVLAASDLGSWPGPSGINHPAGRGTPHRARWCSCGTRSGRPGARTRRSRTCPATAAPRRRSPAAAASGAPVPPS